MPRLFIPIHSKDILLSIICTRCTDFFFHDKKVLYELDFHPLQFTEIVSHSQIVKTELMLL